MDTEKIQRLKENLRQNALPIGLAFAIFIITTFWYFENQSAGYYCGEYCTAKGWAFHSYTTGKCFCVMPAPLPLQGGLLNVTGGSSGILNTP